MPLSPVTAQLSVGYPPLASAGALERRRSWEMDRYLQFLRVLRIQGCSSVRSSIPQTQPFIPQINVLRVFLPLTVITWHLQLSHVTWLLLDLGS